MSSSSTTENPNFIIDAARGFGGASYTVVRGGYNAVINAGGKEDIWDSGATYVKPTAARVHAIVSGSGNDTAAGTGLRTIRVEGLDANGAFQSEVVTLSGVTPVNTANAYTAIFDLIGLTAGSGGVAAGTITCTAATDSTVSATIATGFTNSRIAYYTVPAGFTGLIFSFWGGFGRGITTGELDIVLYTQDPGELRRERTRYAVGDAEGLTGPCIVFPAPIKVPSLGDVFLHATSSTNTQAASGGFNMALIAG